MPINFQRLTRATAALGGGRRAHAFTILELMVAMSVLALMMTMIIQISASALSATKVATQKIEAGEEARSVLATLGGDISNLIDKQGLTVIGKAEGRNSVIAFATRSRGSQSSTRYMGVGYALNANGELMRYTSQMSWTGQDLVSQVAATALPSNTSSSVLASGILRFEAVAVLDDGAIVPLAADPQWNNDIVNGVTLGNSFFGFNLTDATAGRKRVRAIIVGLAAVNERNYKLLKDAGYLNNATGAFPAAKLNQMPMDVWETTLSDGSLKNLPQPVVPAIQIFQHTYPLY